MSADFLASSTQYLSCTTAPITGYPMSFGAWVNLRAVNTVKRSIFSVTDTGSTNSWFSVGITATEILSIFCANAGVDQVGSVGTAMTPGQWYYVVARWIAGTNRRIAVLHPNGVIEHGLSNTNNTPSSLDATQYGCLKHTSVAQPWDGQIAEAWWANADIQTNGLQLVDQTVRNLALGGPFSLAPLMPNLIEYRGFENGPAEVLGDIYFGRNGKLDFVNTGGVSIGPHPSLPAWYLDPSQVKKPLVI